MFLSNINFSYLLKLILCISLICASTQGFALASPGDCIYVPPAQPELEDFYFMELIERSNNKTETFESIRSYIERNKVFGHKFRFKYPLINEEQAQLFAKVLQIKAQQAHLFVPVIASSQFISPSHLGFIRRITIQGDGSTIQEHVLIDDESHAVIFIEEWSATMDKVEKGCFAAVNDVIQEEGQWYFVGTYLYSSKPNESEIDNRIDMFNHTYENMVLFIEKEDVHQVCSQLNEFKNKSLN